MSATPIRKPDDPQAMFGQLRALIESLRLEFHDALDAMEQREPESKEPKGDEIQGLITAASLIESRIQQSEQQMSAAIASAMEPIKAGLERDATYDQQVAQRLDRVDTTLGMLTTELQQSRAESVKLTSALNELIATLRMPKVRSGIVETPQGAVKMTVTETRGK